MDAAFTSYIAQPSVIATLLSSAAGISALAFGVAAVVPRVTDRLIPRPKMTRLSDHLKFKRMHKDGQIILCEEGVHAAIVHVHGVDLRFNTPEQQSSYNKMRESWLEQMNALGIRSRIFFGRDRMPKASDFPHENAVMKQVAQRWAQNLPRALSTEYYIVLSVKDSKKGIPRLREALVQTESILSDYKPKILSDDRSLPETLDAAPTDVRGPNMTPAAFFARMASPISRPTPRGEQRESSLSRKIATDNVRFDDELSMFEFRSGPRRKYAAVLVIEEWSSPMYESTMLELMAYPIEMQICHDMQPVQKGAALATMKYQEKLAPGLQLSQERAEQYADVAAALERASDIEQELFSVQTTITVYGDTPEEVERAYSFVNQLKMNGITPVWPRYSMTQHWFSHFPGFEPQSRPQRLLSGECAILATFQSTPMGKQQSDWGMGPIAMFQTVDGSPYAFQFHAGEGSPPLGHCIAIGPSGQGKTTLITFLAAMALRHNDLKAFFFDRGRGCEIITRALGGKYLQFEGEEGVALNPMQLPDSAMHRSFLRDWLAMIGHVEAESYAEQQEIADAIDINYDPGLLEEHRNLRLLRQSALPPHSRLRSSLMAWTNPEQFGRIVCAKRDALDISTRCGGFDFTNILDDERLGPAMVSYLMHRILSDARGDPRLIFIDETEPLLRNEAFRRRYMKLLQEGRKERQVIISAFQKPSAPQDVGVGETIRGQCPTVFFFRNMSAQKSDYGHWGLNDRELDFILGNTHKQSKYAVLLKRYTENPESVILDANLSPLGDWMKIFQSGRKQVELAAGLQAEFGDDFVPHYLNQA